MFCGCLISSHTRQVGVIKTHNRGAVYLAANSSQKQKGRELWVKYEPRHVSADLSMTHDLWVCRSVESSQTKFDMLNVLKLTSWHDDSLLVR